MGWTRPQCVPIGWVDTVGGEDMEVEVVGVEVVARGLLPSDPRVVEDAEWWWGWGWNRYGEWYGWWCNWGYGWWCLWNGHWWLPLWNGQWQTWPGSL